MHAKRIVIAVLQLCVLLTLLFALYRLSTHEKPIPTAITGDNDEDDMKYAPIVAVSIGPVKRTSLRAYIDGYGIVEPQPARPGVAAAGASINSPTPALVRSVDVVEGQQVKAGQPLFHLDDRAVNALIARAQQDADSAERIAAEFDEKLKTQLVPEAQALRAHANRDSAEAALTAAKAQLAMLTLLAPINGVVTQLRIHVGELTPTSGAAVELVDTDRLVVAVQVPTWQLHELKIGKTAVLGMPHAASSQAASTQPAIDATVTYIDPQIDSRTGLGQVDVAIPSGAQYRVGQFISLRIVTDQHNDCLAVPAASIVRDPSGNQAVSVVLRDYHWAFRRTVQPGIRENGWVEVIGSDLKDGQSVVTTGAYALSDQCQIDVIP